jgi:hypothetical protein
MPVTDARRAPRAWTGLGISHEQIIQQGKT